MRKYKDFMAALFKTETYEVFLQYVSKKPMRTLNIDKILVKEYLMLLQNSKKTKYLWDFDSKEEKFSLPKNMEYSEISQSYEDAQVLNPLIAQSYQGAEYYKYKFFPKLMDKYLISEEALSEVEWPENATDTIKKTKKK